MSHGGARGGRPGAAADCPAHLSVLNNSCVALLTRVTQTRIAARGDQKSDKTKGDTDFTDLANLTSRSSYRRCSLCYEAGRLLWERPREAPLCRVRIPRLIEGQAAESAENAECAERTALTSFQRVVQRSFFLRSLRILRLLRPLREKSWDASPRDEQQILRCRSGRQVSVTGPVCSSQRHRPGSLRSEIQSQRSDSSHSQDS